MNIELQTLKASLGAIKDALRAGELPPDIIPTIQKGAVLAVLGRVERFEIPDRFVTDGHYRTYTVKSGQTPKHVTGFEGGWGCSCKFTSSKTYTVFGRTAQLCKHIAAVSLIEDGHLVIEPVQSVREALERLLAIGVMPHAPAVSFDIAGAINLTHSTSGVIILTAGHKRSKPLFEKNGGGWVKVEQFEENYMEFTR